MDMSTARVQTKQTTEKLYLRELHSKLHRPQNLVEAHFRRSLIIFTRICHQWTHSLCDKIHEIHQPFFRQAQQKVYWFMAKWPLFS